jgi:hypothetical protein
MEEAPNTLVFVLKNILTLNNIIVERIRDYRPRDDHFRVAWVGYDWETWEPRGNLEGNEAFEDYLELHPRARLVFI